jgi:hypothetical protein
MHVCRTQEENDSFKIKAPSKLQEQRQHKKAESREKKTDLKIDLFQCRDEAVSSQRGAGNTSHSHVTDRLITQGPQMHEARASC